ncbi:MAG: DUF3800 domain-containing protein [Solirubrobacteraceae bacterium]
MYTLYLDGSGTHGASPVYILAGIAIHEQDVSPLQQHFAAPLKALPGARDPRDYELHASEIKSPRSDESIWRTVPQETRLAILRSTFAALRDYECIDPARFRCAYFGAVIERSYGDYEQRAWEEVLHRFDEMLTCRGNESGDRQRGIVIHDRATTERRIQDWTDRWRLLSGRIGTLTHITDVPFFADSRASRLLQAADFIAWALWRYYGMPESDVQWIKPLWRNFDQSGGRMHGLVHVSRGFKARVCGCPPCLSRRPNSAPDDSI